MFKFPCLLYTRGDWHGSVSGFIDFRELLLQNLSGFKEVRVGFGIEIPWRLDHYVATAIGVGLQEMENIYRRLKERHIELFRMG